MTYRETLNKAYEHKINVIDLSAAVELDNLIDVEEIELTEEQFEKACSIIRNAYLRANEPITFWTLTMTLIEMIKKGENLNEMNCWDLLYETDKYC